MQTITRKGAFDVCHRVMNHTSKCSSVHGHCYHYELTLGFEKTEAIGYSIDFSEIKRVGCQWIEDMWDHGALLNPHDTTLIESVKALKGKLWLMSLNGEGEYCNPSVENIAKELYLAQGILIASAFKDLSIQSVTLYETPNCFTTCGQTAIYNKEAINFYKARQDAIQAYRDAKGVVEYDDRKVATP
jgi:6-pyruvoyltetrahydropterin/6-carboxytetrahydropterin synthase